MCDLARLRRSAELRPVHLRGIARRIAFTLPEFALAIRHVSWWLADAADVAAVTEVRADDCDPARRDIDCRSPLANPVCTRRLARAEAAPKPRPPPRAAPAAGDTQPTLLGQYGDWGAYTASPGGTRSASRSPSRRPRRPSRPAASRDQSYVFISTRPAENVRNEVSVIIGYPFKTSSDATAEIGTAKFAMYTQNDGAWIKNVTEEARMVDAMRKGADLTVKGTSGRGTQSTDQYSLKGLAQALDRAEQEVRVGALSAVFRDAAARRSAACAGSSCVPCGPESIVPEHGVDRTVRNYRFRARA